MYVCTILLLCVCVCRYIVRERDGGRALTLTHTDTQTRSPNAMHTHTRTHTVARSTAVAARQKKGGRQLLVMNGDEGDVARTFFPLSAAARQSTLERDSHAHARVVLQTPPRRRDRRPRARRPYMRSAPSGRERGAGRAVVHRHRGWAAAMGELLIDGRGCCLGHRQTTSLLYVWVRFRRGQAAALWAVTQTAAAADDNFVMERIQSV